MAEGTPQGAEAESKVETTGEEDYSPEFTPVVKLTEVETVKSDADEEVMWQNKCKLYRFDDGAWKERGLGVAKILKHKTTNKQRFIMHEDKTFKLRSNHLIMPDTKLQQHGGNEKALVFSTIDFAEEKPKEESLCIRFGTAEKAAEFRSKYEDAVKENAQYLTTPKPTATETQTPDETAEVEEKSEEEKKNDDGVDQLTKEMEEKATVEGEEAPAESDKKE